MRALCAGAIAASLLAPVAATAQTPPAEQPASIGHAAAKGVTLKIGNAVTSMVVFSTGTGGLVTGGLLSVIIAATSYSVYVANDYLWDMYSPNTNVAANNPSFSTTTSLSRNTWKFLTFKPAVMLADWSAIYLYTGSFVSMLAMGSAWSLLSPMVFYANNVAWDWYDWYASTGAPPK